MAASDQREGSDENRLSGRTPRTPRPDTGAESAADVDGDEPDDRLDAVTRLMGFLRSAD